MKNLIVVVCVFLCLLTTVLSYSSDPNKPNIVVLLADDLGWNDVGYHGASNIETPNIDDLASSGLRIESHYVLPLCSPTRAAFLTGRYPIHNGIQSAVFKGSDTYGLSINQPLLSEKLSSLFGYKTHMIGKWHLGYAAWQYTPTYRGFDTFFGFYLGEQEKWHHLYTSGDYSGVDLRDGVEQAAEYDGYYSAWLEGNKTIELLNDESKTSDPFFMYLAYSTPHKPVQAPPYMVDKYESIVSGEVRQEYSAMVDVLDDVIGHVVSEMKRLNMWDNTLFIFMSDNGGENQHGDNFPLCGNKNMLYEGGTRSPTFVTGGYLNEIQNGKIINNELMHVTDWYPTIISLIASQNNIDDDLIEEINDEMTALSETNSDEYIGSIDGINQWSFINGESNDKSFRNEFLYNIDPNLCTGGPGSVCGAIRMGEYKYILANRNDKSTWNQIWQSGRPSVDCGDDAKKVYKTTIDSARCQGIDKSDGCLFDIMNDPCEVFDLNTDDNDVSELIDTMYDKLSSYYDTMNDPLEMAYASDEENANPDNKGGFWEPWIDLDDEINSRNPYQKLKPNQEMPDFSKPLPIDISLPIGGLDTSDTSSSLSDASVKIVNDKHNSNVVNNGKATMYLIGIGISIIIGIAVVFQVMYRSKHKMRTDSRNARDRTPLLG